MQKIRLPEGRQHQPSTLPLGANLVRCLGLTKTCWNGILRSCQSIWWGLALRSPCQTRSCWLAWRCSGLITSYLSNRTQQTRVGSCVSEPAQILSGVPQGAILSPLLFTVYVNDIFKCSSSSVNLFADDTSSFIIDSSQKRPAIRELQAEVENLSAYVGLQVAPIRQRPQISSAHPLRASRPNHPEHWLSIRIGDSVIPQVRHHKHLGVTLSESLSWSAHNDAICSEAKTAQRLGLIRRHRSRLPFSTAEDCQAAYVHSLCSTSVGAWVCVSCLVWTITWQCATHWAHLASCSLGYRWCTAKKHHPTWSSSPSRRSSNSLFSPEHHSVPASLWLCPSLTSPSLRECFPSRWCPTKSARSTSLRPHINNLIRLLKANTSARQRSPLYAAIRLWNSLPDNLRTITARVTFHSALKDHFY